MFLHRGYIRERCPGLHSIKAWEANEAVGILNDVAEQIGQWAIRADLGSDVFVTEEGRVSGITTRLIGQQVGFASVGC